MSSVLMESGAAPARDPRLVCSECRGEGSREFEVCSHPFCNARDRRAMGCTHSRTVREECSDCDGTGIVRCDWCGEHPAEVVTASGAYARACVAIAERAA